MNDKSADQGGNLLLLMQALVEAEQARAAGLVIGPPVDKQGIDRAVRRATRRDLARLCTELAGVA
jgi:hypothetical protein